MTSLNTIPRNYMAATESYDAAQWILVGLPYDGTTSFRPGTRFGPQAIRDVSWGLETYSPVIDRDLEDIAFYDAGDLDISIGNREKVLDQMRAACSQVLASGKNWVGLGGEHLCTWPIIQAHLEKYPDLCVIQFDAHADLRNDYLGETLSHACVMRRVVDVIGPGRFAQIGIRSGPREEFAWMRDNGTLMGRLQDLTAKLTAWAGKPIFVTIDMDVLDPSVFPGTGTPEPGGMTFREFQNWIAYFKDHRIIGFDVMELSPQYDASGVSSLCAAKAVREMLLITAAN